MAGGLGPMRGLVGAGRDVQILLAQKFLRMLAYGQTALVMVLFFQELGVSESLVGVFMSLTLLGDVVLSFIVTFCADAMGRRNALILSSATMAVASAIFAVSSNFWVLLASAVVGVISPSGDEIGPFRAIEESTLASLTQGSQRVFAFAWQNILGTYGGALGSLSAGWIGVALEQRGWDKLQVYRAIFVLCSVWGLLKMVLCFFLTDKCERDAETLISDAASHSQAGGEPNSNANAESTESEPLLAGSRAEYGTDTEGGAVHAQRMAESGPLLDAIEQGASGPGPGTVEAPVVEGLASKPRHHHHHTDETVAEHLAPVRQQVSARGGADTPLSSIDDATEAAEDASWVLGLSIKLCLLFGLDSFAYGFMTRSWVVVFFYETFHVSEAVVGNFLFAASLVASLTVLPSSMLTERAGPLLAIVLTKVPAATFAALIPFGPTAGSSFAFLLGRSAADTMDVVPRQIFLANVLPWQFRTRVMGAVNIVKTLGRSVGPIFSGLLAERGKLWAAFEAVAGFEGLFVVLFVFFFVGRSRKRS